MMVLKRSALAGLGFLVAASQAAAAPVTYAFDFTGGSTASYDAEGNLRTFTSGPLSVTASAYNATSTFGALGPAYLGWYVGGLAVTTSEADTFPIDNLSGPEAVVLQFSAPVTLLAVSLFSGAQANATLFFGSAPLGKDFSGASNTTAGLGLNALGNFFCDTTCESYETVVYQPNPGNLIGNTLVVEGYIAGFADLFEIAGVLVSYDPVAMPPDVPEPESLVMLGGSLLALGLARRRR